MLRIPPIKANGIRFFLNQSQVGLSLASPSDTFKRCSSDCIIGMKTDRTACKNNEVPRVLAQTKQGKCSYSQCHVPYFLGPSPSYSGLPATFPPVPDPFRVSFSYPHPFRFLLLSSDLSHHPSFPCFPLISVYLFVSTRFLSVFHIRIRP